MDQLQLEFPTDKQRYIVRMYRDYERTETCTKPEFRAFAESTRSTLVGLLKRSPYSFDWEDTARSTGWYGVKYDLNRSTLYQLIIEPYEESPNE